jgi:hypothetical protein
LHPSVRPDSIVGETPMQVPDTGAHNDNYRDRRHPDG